MCDHLKMLAAARKDYLMSLEKNKIETAFFYFSFSVYLLLFLWIIIFTYVSPLELFDQSRPVIRGVNLIPFHEIGQYLSGSANVSRTVVISNIIGNIVIFTPLGLYLPLLINKNNSFLKNVFAVALISLSIEIIQFVFAIGISDIDDIILNTVGGALGIAIFNLLSFWIKDRVKIRTLITVVSTILALPLLILLILLYLYN